MARALRLAERGINTATPNPRVGCVITNAQGDVLGEGFHCKAGEAHAEINALNDVIARKASAEGATVYVTLEPCSHTGKTGPCADALIQANVGRVVYGMEDPNPEVAGNGLEKLKAAGIEIDGPLMEDQARELNRGFIKRMQYGLPFVRLKMAMSMDGRTAMASGESKWITGPNARQDVQTLRASACAIITGVESVINDNPALTVRLGENDRQPLRIIVDTRGRCPQKADILNQSGSTILAVGESTEIEDGRRHWKLPLSGEHVNLRALLQKLAQEGCNEVIVETGATLAGAFVANGLVDEFIIYCAPILLGSDARPLFKLPIGKMSSQLPLIVQDIRAIGGDWRIIATPDPVG
ncbi:MAG: bifunctional diaminohydroxyphosphoribosylaminopyrimidine deaminase/5-amino-6-(5-phosphoribosylamino)uracil reductase RibD [Agarilytica sp.]